MVRKKRMANCSPFFEIGIKKYSKPSKIQDYLIIFLLLLELTAFEKLFLMIFDYIFIETIQTYGLIYQSTLNYKLEQYSRPQS